MQITQTVSEDLRRQYTVTILASELDAKVTKRLEEMKPRDQSQGLPSRQGACLLPQEAVRQVRDGRGGRAGRQ